jgi:hypothetical protein
VGTGGNSAVATLAGGTTTISSGGVYVGEITPGVLTVMGNAQLIASGALGISFGNAGQSATGILNLNGGTITTPRVQVQTSGASVFNFNGGTLKASASSATFMSGLTGTYVLAGGAIIDDGGYAITIPQALVAPNACGIQSITVANGGSGYIDSPLVQITGGSGSNPTAIAQIDYNTGSVTNILVTRPGRSYLITDVLTVR